MQEMLSMREQYFQSDSLRHTSYSKIEATTMLMTSARSVQGIYPTIDLFTMECALSS